jgi:hypothetical protein
VLAGDRKESVRIGERPLVVAVPLVPRALELSALTGGFGQVVHGHVVSIRGWFDGLQAAPSQKLAAGLTFDFGIPEPARTPHLSRILV